MAQTANQDPASIMFNWTLKMRRERRQKRKCICWIAQFFNLRDSSAFFLLLKNRKGNTSRELLQPGLQIMLGEQRDCLGREKEKDWGISLTDWSSNSSHVVLHWLHSLRLCSGSAGLSLHGAFTGILKHPAVTSAPQRRITSPYFWRDYFELSHLLRLQGLALLYQNCSV